MTDQQRLKVIDKIYKWVKQHPEYLNQILQDLTENFGDYIVIDDKPCECCGDIIDEYKLVI